MKNEKSLVFIIGGILFLIIAGVLIYHTFTTKAATNLKDDVYSEFTCTCCDGSLLETSESCYMGGGMKLYIDNLILQGYDKTRVMEEAVKKFGVMALIDRSKQEEYGYKFLESLPSGVPNMSIEPLVVDLGNISISKGIFIQDYKIKNNGDADLIITDISTSCACLHASFIKDGRETVRMGRFSHEEGWQFVLRPGENAILRGYLDARVTNWQLGHVERFITIVSNDPVHFNSGVAMMMNLVP